LYEIFTIPDDFAVEGVDDGIGLLEEAVDTTYFLQIILPLAGVLDDDTEVDVFILGFNASGDLLALSETWLT
jgi:hypothetical protein